MAGKDDYTQISHELVDEHIVKNREEGGPPARKIKAGQAQKEDAGSWKEKLLF
jgi:hypothetical protein